MTESHLVIRHASLRAPHNHLDALLAGQHRQNQRDDRDNQPAPERRPEAIDVN